MSAKREMRSLTKSFRNAFRGIRSVAKYERNFRIHMCMMFYVLVFSIIGEVQRADILRFILCFGIVMAAELVNTAIELLCDAVSGRFDERIREIKDIAAGAVLVCAISAAAVGLITFLSPDVLGRVVSRLISMPYVTVLGIISLPFAGWFVMKRGR